MSGISIQGCGMMTPVGLSAEASCAAMRCGIHAAAETRFVGSEGDWLMGCTVPAEPALRGLDRLAYLAAAAVRECVDHAQRQDVSTADIPLLLGVAERSRPGRLPELEERLPGMIARRLGVEFHPHSAVIARGRTSAFHGLAMARQLLQSGARACILAGVDSLLVGRTLSFYLEAGRLLDGSTSNGFIPGEAAAAVLVTRVRGDAEGCRCLGVGFGREPAPITSEEPSRADGIVEAVRSAFREAGVTYDDLQYRIADVSGEQYGFKEAQLAIGRTLRGKMKPRFDLWHPADSIGEVGAAIGPCMLGVVEMAGRKGYAPGPGVMCHAGNDDGRRAAAVLHWEAAGR